MKSREEPNSPQASDMLKAICSAGERCSCADKNYQWYDTNCEIGIAHVNAISLRLSRSAQCVPPHIEKTEAGTINWKMEVDRLNRLLCERDDFIVRKGLWLEFTDSLRP